MNGGGQQKTDLWIYPVVAAMVGLPIIGIAMFVATGNAWWLLLVPFLAFILS